MGFDDAPGGFGGPTTEGTALGTKLGEVGSVPCAASSGPLDDPCGLGGADTIHSGPSGAANPTIVRNPCSTSFSSDRGGGGFPTGGNDQTNGGCLVCSKRSKVPELSLSST